MLLFFLLSGLHPYEADLTLFRKVSKAVNPVRKALRLISSIRHRHRLQRNLIPQSETLSEPRSTTRKLAFGIAVPYPSHSYYSICS